MFNSFALKLVMLLLFSVNMIACSGATDSSTTTLGLSTGTTTSSLDQSSNQPTISKTSTITWLPPTENTDGSAITELNSYNIYYGTSPSDLANKIEVNNPSITEYVIEDLDSNTTYYFAVTAVSNQNMESTFSNVVIL